MQEAKAYQTNYNISIDILLKHSSTKLSLDLFAFATMIKVHFRSSTLTEVSVDKVQSFLKCSRQKACVLFKAAKENTDLFRYDERLNQLIAKTHRNLNFKTVRKGKKFDSYRSDFVFRCPRHILESKTHREMVMFLKEVAIVHAIKARPTNCSNPIKENTSDINVKKDVTLGYISTATGFSLSTISRILKRLASDKSIDKEASVIHAFAEDTPEHRAAFERQYGRKPVIAKKIGMLLMVLPCLYALNSHFWVDGFRHRIYNYHTSSASFQKKNVELNTACYFDYCH